ncbi:hypothetical protein KC19_2G219300 [Ceratodon purpureus]|uniref:Uncharacterized protein n=1 Tax=Ceratodon purpureus TaxID=3225 RepID=A0A8T0IWQ2_CERPU|nr:hypothetical protein KC19_2G219300 [Ceratodon purpureus]
MTKWPPPCEEDFLTHRQPNPHRHCSSSSCTPATPIFTSSLRHHCPGPSLHIPYSQVSLMPTLSAIVGSILDSVVHCGCGACMHVLAVLIDALGFVSGVCDLLLVVASESRGRKLPRARGV